MKKLLLIPLLFASTANAEFNLGVYGSNTDHDKSLYEVTTNPVGVSFALTHYLDESFFVKGEVVANEHNAGPAASLGVKFSGVSLSGGIGRSQERATYVFGGDYANGNSTDDYTYHFVDIEYSGLFVRAVKFDTGHTFVGSHKSNPFAASVTASVNEDRTDIQLGYRLKF